MINEKDKIPAWLIPVCFAFYLVLNIISWQFPFFWDTLLTSTICSWFFNNHWHFGIPPENIDAGHPPLFYAYIFNCWKLLGRNLQSSHLAMLPFLWVMIYQFIQICDRLLSKSWQITGAAILFCLETTIIAQSTMVSYDIAILAFYLFGLRNVMDNKHWPVVMAGIVLSLISLRGVFAFGALFITEYLLYHNSRNFKHITLKYIPAVLVFILWNVWHYKISGWFLFTPSDQWADQRGWAGISGSIRNVIIIIRNLLEPGRLLLFSVIFIGLFNRKWLKDHQMKKILIISVVPLVIFSLLFIPFNNPIGHRYLMIVFALSIIMLMAIIAPFKNHTIWIVGIALTMVSGHFWYRFYPNSVSKGWDASLAHIPYFMARKQMWQYCDDNNISIADLSAKFPVNVSFDQSNLNDDKRRPQEFKGHHQYVLTSTVNNNFEAEELDSIFSHYDWIKTIQEGGIEMNLYELK